MEGTFGRMGVETLIMDDDDEDNKFSCTHCSTEGKKVSYSDVEDCMY